MRMCYYDAGFPEPDEAFFSLFLSSWHYALYIKSSLRVLKTHHKSPEPDTYSVTSNIGYTSKLANTFGLIESSSEHVPLSIREAPQKTINDRLYTGNNARQSIIHQ